MKGHILLGVLWGLFCFFHSYLANAGVKQSIATKLRSYYKYYRLFYTVFAFVTLTILLIYQFALPSPKVFLQTKVSFVSGGIIGAAGLFVMAICIKKYFMSLSGIKTLVTDQTANDLQITGIHKYVRHPLYSGTFLFIWGLFIVIPFASLLIANIIITGYTLLGIKWEEEKLVAEFGESYYQYKKSVPKLIPFIKPLH
jgi:protein-S-isoprenylcysteine O-methyltransferase Ste14